MELGLIAFAFILYSVVFPSKSKAPGKSPEQKLADAVCEVVEKKCKCK
jgi:hypothetical protein